MFSSDDYQYMARALELAQRGLFSTDPNPRVGCVLVRDGRIVGEGWHARAGQPHAEIHALEAAGEQAQRATAYITLEPCCHQGRTGPCTRALIGKGVQRVVAAMEDPNPQVAGQGFRELAAAGIQVSCGILQDQARSLNPGFILRMQHGRPFLRCKLAMSLDGRTAMTSGESMWITGPAARRDVQRLRARSSAILTGIGTVLADDPALDVRPEEIALQAEQADPRQPLRIVLDPALAIPSTARILTRPGRTVVATVAASGRTDRYKSLAQTGAHIVQLPGTEQAIDLPALMHYLAQEEVNEVLLEAGATLSGAMLQAGFIDELVIYMAPVLMGSTARSLFLLPGLTRMAEAIPLEILEIRAIGRDYRITARFTQRS